MSSSKQLLTEGVKVCAECKRICRETDSSCARCGSLLISKQAPEPEGSLRPLSLLGFVAQQRDCGQNSLQYFYRVKRWAINLAQSLAFLHSKRPAPFVHGNLNPLSLLVSPEDESFELLDPSALGENSGEVIEKTYRAPELKKKEAKDPRIDIYSFGKILAFMLTGEHIESKDTCFEADSYAEDTQEVYSLKKTANRCCLPVSAGRFERMRDVVTALRLGDRGLSEDESLIVCAKCSQLNLPTTRLCQHCSARLHDIPLAASQVGRASEQVVYHREAETVFTKSFQTRPGSSSALSRFRMRSLLDGLELQSGFFAELLCFSHLPDVVARPYQKKAALDVLQRMRGCALLADEVGLGKTIEAGLVLKELLLRGLAERVLVLCPRALLDYWQNELYQKFDEVFLVFGRDVDSNLAWHCSRLIAPYEVIGDRVYSEALSTIEYDLVLVDEAHNLSDQRNLPAYEAIGALRKKYLLLLSGTPVQRSLVELYQLVNLLRPGFFGDIHAFKREFVHSKDPLRAKKVGTLKTRLNELMTRTCRQDVKDKAFVSRRVELIYSYLPSRTKEKLDLILSELETLLSSFEKNELPSELEDFEELVCSSPGAVVGRINLILQNRGLRETLGEAGYIFLSSLRTQVELLSAVVEPKLSALLEILEFYLESKEKVLIFSKYQDTCSYIYQTLKRTPLEQKAFLYDLSQSPEQRKQTLRRFNTQDGGFLVCPGESARELEPQDVRAVVNFELTWNPMDLEKRFASVLGFNSTCNEILLLNLVLMGTVEERISRKCTRVLERIAEVFGAAKDIVGQPRAQEDIRSLMLEYYPQDLPVADKRELAQSAAPVRTSTTAHLGEIDDVYSLLCDDEDGY